MILLKNTISLFILLLSFNNVAYTEIATDENQLRKSERALERECYQNISSSCVQLGIRYLKDKSDIENGLKVTKHACLKDSGAGCYLVGITEWQVNQNIKEAYHYLNKACSLKHYIACHYQGALLNNELMIPMSAKKYFSTACANGIKDSCSIIQSEDFNVSVIQNEKEANEYFEMLESMILKLKNIYFPNENLTKLEKQMASQFRNECGIETIYHLEPFYANVCNALRFLSYIKIKSDYYESSSSNLCTYYYKIAKSTEGRTIQKVTYKPLVSCIEDKWSNRDTDYAKKEWSFTDLENEVRSYKSYPDYLRSYKQYLIKVIEPILPTECPIYSTNCKSLLKLNPNMDADVKSSARNAGYYYLPESEFSFLDIIMIPISMLLYSFESILGVFGLLWTITLWGIFIFKINNEEYLASVITIFIGVAGNSIIYYRSFSYHAPITFLLPIFITFLVLGLLGIFLGKFANRK